MFKDYIEDVGMGPGGIWDRAEDGYDKFMLVFPAHLYVETEADTAGDGSNGDGAVNSDITGEEVTDGDTADTATEKKYKEETFAGTDDYDPTVGHRIVVCGKRTKDDDDIPPAPEGSVFTKEEIWVFNNTLIAASVAGVIAGGYRNFTTHLRQIILAKENRQDANPQNNPGQSNYIGCVVLAGNSFIEGSMTYGVKDADANEQTNRRYIDRTVLEDRLQSRLQEECLKIMTYGDGVPFTQQGANMIAAGGAVALSEAAGLKIIDDFETEVNYNLVTEDDITVRKYDKLVYRFRFSGSIEYVVVVLEV